MILLGAHPIPAFPSPRLVLIAMTPQECASSASLIKIVVICMEKRRMNVCWIIFLIPVRKKSIWSRLPQPSRQSALWHLLAFPKIRRPAVVLLFFQLFRHLPPLLLTWQILSQLTLCNVTIVPNALSTNQFVKIYPMACASILHADIAAPMDEILRQQL